MKKSEVKTLKIKKLQIGAFSLEVVEREKVSDSFAHNYHTNTLLNMYINVIVHKLKGISFYNQLSFTKHIFVKG